MNENTLSKKIFPMGETRQESAASWLRQRDYCCSPKRVARPMRAGKLRGLQREVFPGADHPKRRSDPAPNLLLRRKATSVPGRVWVADITFIFTKEGWLYVAGVMDPNKAAAATDSCSVKNRSVTATKAIHSALG